MFINIYIFFVFIAVPKVEPKEDNISPLVDKKGSTRDAASPRVTSTASPPPQTPMTVQPQSSTSTSLSKSNENDTEDVKKLSSAIKLEKSQSTSNSNVENINESPESPDSSSVTVDSGGGGGNSVDSTKAIVIEKNKTLTMKNNETKDEIISDEKKNNEVESIASEIPTTSEAYQKRFLAAFPSNEWGNVGFGNFIKSLTAQAEAQSKNAKAAD